MKIDLITNLIIPAMFLIVFIGLVIFDGNRIVESWNSFLYGVLFTLSARDVANEVSRRVENRQKRRRKLK